MNFAVLQFPASNCDQDAVHAVRHFGHSARLVWHKDASLGDALTREIAVRAGVPILVATHQGSEAWSAELPLGQDVVTSVGRWLPERWRKQLDRSGLLSVPLVPLAPIEAFKMRYDLYHPVVSIAQLDAAPGKAERLDLLSHDAEAVRAIVVPANEQNLDRLQAVLLAGGAPSASQAEN